MTNRDIQAMTRLLDDPDALVYHQIEQHMISMGNKIIPILEDTWKKSHDNLVQSRIEHILDTIHFKDVIVDFSNWKEISKPDLMDALVILNRVQYPNVDCSAYYARIDEYVREMWLELSDNLTAFEKVNVINKVIFDLWKFRSVNENAYDVFLYNFMSNLMELKCGNQFSIACLYLIFAEKLDLPIHPVLLEDQLILAYMSSDTDVEDVRPDDVLFYINPNEGGIVFDENSIRRWIEKHKLENRDAYYLPVNMKQLVDQYLRRLIKGFKEENELKKVNLLRGLRS